VLRIDCTDTARRASAVAAALAACRRGDVVLVPTESSYALATDAFAARGRAAIRTAKGQGAHVPLPVLVPSATTVQGLAGRIPQPAAALMAAFWPGPLTLLVPAQSTLAWDVPADTPIAVRMPLHPLLLALLEQTGPLAVTAANGPGFEPPASVDEAIEQLGEAWALALDAGPLAPAEASTIVDVTGEVPIVRRHGAVPVAQLRSVCPGLIDPADETVDESVDGGAASGA
jgi:L-threonylcarbamoyladenylate synthase